MDYKNFKTEVMPQCKTCEEYLDYWILGQTDYEHLECSSERISNKLIELVKFDL